MAMNIENVKLRQVCVFFFSVGSSVQEHYHTYKCHTARIKLLFYILSVSSFIPVYSNLLTFT